MKPAEYKAADISSVQQLERGTATPEMQIRFLNWMITEVCGTYDQSYVKDTHETAFNEGKRFVGNTLIKMLKLEPGKLRSLE